MAQRLCAVAVAGLIILQVLIMAGGKPVSQALVKCDSGTFLDVTTDYQRYKDYVVTYPGGKTVDFKANPLRKEWYEACGQEAPVFQGDEDPPYAVRIRYAPMVLAMIFLGFLFGLLCLMFFLVLFMRIAGDISRGAIPDDD